MSKLHCKYVHGSSAWLRLAPIKLEINSFDPYHVVLRELLYDHECDDITKYLGPKLDFPPGRMHHKAKKNDWTMKKSGEETLVLTPMVHDSNVLFHVPVAVGRTRRITRPLRS